MIKTFESSSWDWQDAYAYLVKVGSRGLRGNDRADFIKRAGHNFIDRLENIRLAPDEQPVHLVVVGATEDFSANRNGDGFKRAACREYHPTFVKLGRLYRDHINDDPENSYGRIIDSVFHEPLKRIELLVGYNGSEKTAAVNRGHVATREMNKLNSGKDLALSMACKVAYDVCSGCGHKAKNRSEYCDEDTCEYGGLKHNISKVAADGHVLHADNPHPFFFDCSDVGRPADKIAYSLGLLKSASVRHDPVIWTPDSENYRQQFLFDELVATEDNVKAASYDVGLKLVGNFIQPPTGYPLPVLFSALAMQKIALPFADFLKLVGCDAQRAENTASQLRDGIATLYKRADSRVVNNTGYYRATLYAIPPEVRDWASKLATSYSLSPDSVASRVGAAVIRSVAKPAVCSSTLVKSASAESELLLDEYREYQTEFLDAVRCKYPDEFAKISIFTIRRNKLE